MIMNTALQFLPASDSERPGTANPRNIRDKERTEMSDSDLKAELEQLRAERAQLKNKDKARLSLKVSEKGAVSLYAMGRFPVTLYKEKWLRILASAPLIETFILENEAKLKTKE
jgi:hypothetical protein